MVVVLSYWGSIALYVAVFFLSACMTRAPFKSRVVRVVAISFLPILIAGARYNVGWDYGSYALGFALFDPDTSLVEEVSNFEFGNSIGLTVIQKIAKAFDSQFLFFALSEALCYVPAVWYLVNEWDEREMILPVAVFIASFTLFFTELSAIKQGIAIAFCLCSLTFVFKRKPIGFLICVFIGFLFHNTALIFLPVYFFWSKNELSGWRKAAVTVGAMLLVIFIGEIVSLFGSDRMNSYVSETVLTNNRSFILMLFWFCVFFVLRGKFGKLDKRNELLILMYAVAVILMTLGYTNAFAKRLALFFDVVQIMLFPQFMYLFNDVRLRRVIAFVIGAYFVVVCILLNSGTATNMAPIPYSFLIGG